MSEKLEMQTFRYGEEEGMVFQVPMRWQGRYLRTRVGVKYEDPDMIDQSIAVPGKYLHPSILLIEESHKERCEDDSQAYPVTITYIIAENEAWVEYHAIPLYSYSSGNASNCDYNLKFEILLMIDDYSRRLFLTRTRNTELLWFADMDNIIDEIYDNSSAHFAKILDDETFELEFYSDEGEKSTIKIDGDYIKFEELIVSLRLVFFDMVIKE